MSPDSADFGDDLRDLERTRLKALVSRDMPTAVRLHAPDYQLITPGGAALGREEYLGAIDAGALDYRIFEPASPLAVVASTTLATVRYVARIDIRLKDGRDGGLFWHTDLYVLLEGRWQAKWSQATRIPAVRDDTASVPSDPDGG